MIIKHSQGKIDSIFVDGKWEKSEPEKEPKKVEKKEKKDK